MTVQSRIMTSLLAQSFYISSSPVFSQHLGPHPRRQMSEASLTRRDCNRITRDISRRLCPEVSMRLPRLCTPLLFVVVLLAGLFAVSSIASGSEPVQIG